MPPHKKPKTLEKICLNTVARSVVNACGNIATRYGNVDEEICRHKLNTLQRCLLSRVQPLFNELCRAILETCYYSSRETQDRYRLRDCRALLDVITCEQTRTLNLRKSTRILDSRHFLKNQISKLRNIVKLDIRGVTPTDEIFEEISKVCKNLCEICVKSNLEISSKDSVYKLLECKNLQFVRIDFLNWNDKREIIGCVQSFVKGLRRLRHINYDEMGAVLLDERMSPTSLWKLTEKCANVQSVTNMIARCPYLLHLNVDSHFSSRREKEKILDILTESSQHFQSLRLRRFPFAREMEQLLKLKGNNLLRLTISLNAGTITHEDVCTIGVNCPNIEQLEIVETYSIFGNRNFQNQTSKIHPRVFVNLKSLTIEGDSKWDQSMLPLMLSHARGLEKIDLKNVLNKDGADGLSVMLDVNPLKELTSFKLVAERCGGETADAVPVFGERSIRRLVDSCAKLTSLELDCVFEGCAIRYLEDLKRKIIHENLDLRVLFRNVKCASDVCDVGAPGGYHLHYEY